MVSFKLSRKFITGPLDDDVPTSVLLEMCVCSSISVPTDYTRLTLLQYINVFQQFSEIENYDEETIYNITDEDIERNDKIIARFTSGNSTLTRTSLKVAFRHLLKFDRKLQTKYLRGPKTRNNPESYDACMLYSLCKEYGILMRSSSTIQDMANALEIRAKALEGGVIIPSFLSNDLRGVDIDTLLRLNFIPKYEPKNVNLDDLDYYNRSLSIITDLLSRINITNHNEAIVFAAKYFGLNILQSSNPIEEVRRLQKLQKGDSYIPFDPIFRKNYLSNVNWYQIYKTYTPEMDFLYDSKRINEFFKYEGFVDGLSSIENDEDKLVKLRSSRMINNFYEGRTAYCTNVESLILFDDLSNYDSNTLVSYGSVVDKTMVCFTMVELANHFMACSRFTNPLNKGEIFTESCIAKLGNICRTVLRSTISLDEVMGVSVPKSDAQKLQDAIEFVKMRLLEVDEKLIDLRSCYDNVSDQDKKIIVNLFQTLLESGMYMRGWKVSCNHYPLLSIDTVSEPSRFDEIENNVKRSLDAFKELLNSSPILVQSTFLCLPLINMVKFDNGLKLFIGTEESGRNIMERINIIEEGKTPYSCIRISSNWIVSSAYYYMSELYIDPKFDILQLAQIS